MLTREAILAAEDLKRETVPVPEWGGEGATVTVRMMTSAERMGYFEKAQAFAKAAAGARDRLIEAALVATTVCDAGGALLFTAEDIELLAGKNAIVVNRIAEAAAVLNQIGDGRRKALAKN